MCWSYNPPLSFGNNESLDLSTQFPTASIVLLCTLLQKILLSRCRVFIFPGLRGYFPPRKKQSTLNSTMFFLPHVLPPFFLRFLFYKKNKRINCSCFTEICGYRTSQFHLSSGTNNDVQKIKTICTKRPASPKSALMETISPGDGHPHSGAFLDV